MNALRIAKTIVQGLTDAAFLLDRQLRLVNYNRGVIAFSGLRVRPLTKALASRSAFALVGREGDRSLALEALESLRTVRFDEVCTRSPNGDERLADVSIIPIPEGDHAAGLIYVIRDVTAESAIHKHNKQLLKNQQDRAAQLERVVEERTRELTVTLEEVTRLAGTDPLTGALNRRALAEHAEQSLSLAIRYDRHMALLMCDLDHFKRVNDTYGHPAGDTILKESVAAMTQALRRSDKIGRFGGEEFAVVLSETDRDSFLMVAERLNKAIRDLPVKKLLNGADWKQTVSIGCAMFPEHGRTIDQLIASADRALYQAKEDGRDRVVCFSGELSAALEADQTGGARYRILIVDLEPKRPFRAEEALAQRHQLVIEYSMEEALARAKEEAFDVLLTRELGPTRIGPSFLYEALVYQPDAVRISMTVERPDHSEQRWAESKHIDYSLREVADPSALLSAIDDGLKQRDLNIRRLLERSRKTRHLATRSTVRGLRDLLEQRAFSLVYQPVVSGNEDGAIRGFEALCRPETRFFKGPLSLFDVAVHAGKIWELCRLVRSRVADAMMRLDPKHLMFVNIHPAALEDPTLLSGQDPICRFADRVVFEITERSTISDFRRCMDSLRRLKEAGFRFAVDDLGAGHAGLSAAALLEPEFMKMDRTLIQGIADSPNKMNLALRIIQFADDVGIKVIAEGIEIKEEVEVLRKLKCHLMQGYYFARPTTDIASFYANGVYGRASVA